MPQNNPPKAQSDNKSGVTNKEYLSTQLDGLPPRKSVDEIDKVNMPKKAPGSSRA